MGKSTDDGYSPPPIVEWLSFTVDQLKASVNLFSTEVQVVLTEFVDKNLTDLLREDYKSAKISQRVVKELQEKVKKVIENLREQSSQAEEELSARFPLLRSGSNKSQNEGLTSTHHERRDSNSEGTDPDNIAGGSGGHRIQTASINESLDSISDDENDDSCVMNGTEGTGTENQGSDLETLSGTGSEDEKMTKSTGRSSKPDQKSLNLATELVSDDEMELPVEDLLEEPTLGNVDIDGSVEIANKESSTGLLELDSIFESPASPAETVFFDSGKGKRSNAGGENDSQEGSSVETRSEQVLAKNSIYLPPPSPPETVFLGPSRKSSTELSRSKQTSSEKIPLIAPPSPPETVFLGKANTQKSKNVDPENQAKEQVLSLISDDEMDMDGPPSPTETVFLRKPLVDKDKVNAPFKNPKKLSKVKVESDDSTDYEEASSSKAFKKASNKKEKTGQENDSGSRASYSYLDDFKLNPGVCYVKLERLPGVILDRLRTHKTVDFSCCWDGQKGGSRRRRLESEDEITKALRRLASFNPCVKGSCASKESRKKTRRSLRDKRKKSDDEFNGRGSDDDASTEDSSNEEPVLKRTVLPQQGMAKEDLVGSDDEDLSGAVSSSSEEDNARKCILKGAGDVKAEVDSDDDGKKLKNKKQKKGESYYTPGVCQLPEEELSSNSDSDDFVKKKKLKKKKNNTVILSDDSDRENACEKNKKSGESDDDVLEISSDDSDFGVKKPRRKGRRYSTDSDSDYQKKKRTRKRVKELSDSDASTGKKPKKRIKKELNEVRISSGSDSDVKEVTDENADKGRKNIRNIMTKKDLHKATRLAEQEEENRKKRIAERQAQFNEMFQAPETEVAESLVLDFEPESKEPLISVDSNIVKKLKPHQLEGIRFMWNACFESVEEFKKSENSGGGCILAHCMGLGKTLQTVAFLNTVMTSEQTKLKTALVICPLNTVGNWYNEFKMWLRNVKKSVYVHKLYDEKNNENRAYALEAWHRRGGVGIINYESFRTLVLGQKMKKSIKNKIRNALVDPGPEIVVCDEGHLFKNAKSKLALAVNQIKTKRRVILTGTPLQNNLGEYHCMMEFVKPKLLGSKKEFSNRFVNPITNGQHKDSTSRDVSIMKKRAHVLHKLLDGCVQRLDYTVLVPYLPPKYEYVILIHMSEIQKKMYEHYLKSIKQDNSLTELISGGQLLKHAANLAKIWSHPYALELKSANYNADSSSDSAGSLKDFIDDRSETCGSGSDSDIDWLDSEFKKVDKSKKTPATVKTEEVEEVGPTELSAQTIKDGGDWWSQFFKSKSEMQLLENGSKLVVLFEILKTCESIQDKVLIFSQYLYSLDIIEAFLEELDQQERNKNIQDTFPPQVSRTRWRKNIEYFRIDGSTKSADRQKNCDIFNKTKTDTTRAKLFLISTKAGGLGINLIGANRVVIFDASWNPSQDMQSIFRVFRFGQTKPCYIYRLLAKGTMEEKIYNRQVVKLSLSGRVVDEHQLERHFTFEDLAGMYSFDPDEKSNHPTPPVPKDRLLADLLISQKDKIETYLEHDTLLQNKVDEGLTEEERKMAWDEYQNENLLRERREQASAQAHSEMQAEMQATMKMRDKLRSLFPSLTEDKLNAFVRQINNEIADLRRLTMVFHASKANLSDADKIQWNNTLQLRKSKIQSYFGYSPGSAPQASNFTSESGGLAEGGIRLANLNNILEPPNFAQYYNQNPSILNRRTYPTNTQPPSRRNIITNTVPYQNPVQQVGSPIVSQFNTLPGQSNPALSQLPTVDFNPNF